MQITPGGRRVQLKAGGKQWWAVLPNVKWEAFETSDGLSYASRDEADGVAKNLEIAASLLFQDVATPGVHRSIWACLNERAEIRRSKS